MAMGAQTAHVVWWKEPTHDQWYAWWAAWLGWTLDAFDFTVFLLIMNLEMNFVFGLPPEGLPRRRRGQPEQNTSIELKRARAKLVHRTE
jgi:hypothetical protein